MLLTTKPRVAIPPINRCTPPVRESIAPYQSNVMKYNSLAVNTATDLMFDVAPNPLTARSGMVIGGGTVYPN